MTTTPPPLTPAQASTGPLSESQRLARLLQHAALDLYETAALHDAAWMWEEARAIASRILAACPAD